MTNKDYVIYPAVFELSDEPDFEGVYNVSFPDIPGCLTFGKGIDRAMYMAQDALGLLLYDEPNLPTPTPIEDIQEAFSDKLVNYVGVNLVEAAEKVKVVTVKKNTSIPMDLAKQGEEYGINFSALLTRALKSEIEHIRQNEKYISTDGAAITSKVAEKINPDFYEAK
ncbi:MAG: type II toxin-antitoxin system HicB family antitoxin [Clostridiales Family XIII bacterium]|jgi:predicted RNase H-like HicB family nuclease/post-segregation antitoxin (ccd killing protein)|nr:type II toxin-antitoxin system HicB family antitoxin [Clostridiales Family XIII bacterium]